MYVVITVRDCQDAVVLANIFHEQGISFGLLSMARSDQFKKKPKYQKIKSSDW